MRGGDAWQRPQEEQDPCDRSGHRHLSQILSNSSQTEPGSFLLAEILLVGDLLQPFQLARVDRHLIDRLVRCRAVPVLEARLQVHRLTFAEVRDDAALFLVASAALFGDDHLRLGVDVPVGPCARVEMNARGAQGRGIEHRDVAGEVVGEVAATGRRRCAGGCCCWAYPIQTIVTANPSARNTRVLERRVMLIIAASCEPDRKLLVGAPQRAASQVVRARAERRGQRSVQAVLATWHDPLRASFLSAP